MTLNYQDSGRRDADLRLIHALQIEPRASWADLGRVLRTDPVALARRWARIVAEGHAWVTGVPRQYPVSAIVEVECEPGSAAASGRVLEAEVEVRTMDYTAGRRDIIAAVGTSSIHALSALTLDRLDQRDIITRVRTHIVTEYLLQGDSWRLDALTDAEVRSIPPARSPRARASRTVSDHLTRVIFDELYRDGRAPTGQVAERAGVSTQTVADAISTLRHAGRLVLRTDVARVYTGWPINAWYFLQVPMSILQLLTQSLSKMQEVRLAATISSEFNVVMAVWLRDLPDVNRFEMRLEKAIGGSSAVRDRAVVIRPGTHLGRTLDDCGFVTDTRAGARTLDSMEREGDGDGVPVR
ncbi:Lrp/AsnC family transcriptional regulator [Rhodococcus jostii]|uniref:Lrp/AsnC family transcriptional regulator n=1 Tax=Rhodococcus jostii TaxID=132919 RepID=UPI003638F248